VFGKRASQVRSEVLTEVTMKTTVFWGMTSYGLVYVCRCCTETCCFHHRTYTIELYAKELSKAAFMELTGSLPRTQEPATGPCAEPHEGSVLCSCDAVTVSKWWVMSFEDVK
jgi:hypothetical protein